MPNEISVSEKQPKLTKRNLRKFQEQQYLDNLPSILKDLFPAIRKGCRDGNSQIIRMTAELCGVVSRKDGPLISLNVMQQNNVSTAEANGVASLESLIRKLDARERDAGSKTVIDIQRS